MSGYKERFMSQEDRDRIARQQQEAQGAGERERQRKAAEAETEKQQKARIAEAQRKNEELQRINETRLGFVPEVLEGHRDARREAGVDPQVTTSRATGAIKPTFNEKGVVLDEHYKVVGREVSYSSDYISVTYDQNTDTLVVSGTHRGSSGFYIRHELHGIPANPEALIAAVKRCESGALTREECEEERRKSEEFNADEWERAQAYRRGIEG